MTNSKVTTSIEPTTYKHNKHGLAHKHKMDLFTEATDTATKKKRMLCHNTTPETISLNK